MSLRILVVEDDLPSLELMQAILTNAQADVTATDDSSLAARFVNSQRYDGIFLDLRMPGLNGLQLTEIIRASTWNRATPVIIVSGEPPSAMPESFAAGATFYLAKPVDQRKLLKLFHATRSAMVLSKTRSARISFTAPVTCTAGARAIAGISANLSAGGLLFEAGNRLQPGERVQVRFDLPDNTRSVFVTALVVRVDEKGRAGLSFLSLPPEDQLRIRQLVSAHAA